jgi:hypothetical protein
MAGKKQSPDVDKKKGGLSPREAAAQEHETGQREVRRSAHEDVSERKAPEPKSGEGISPNE